MTAVSSIISHGDAVLLAPDPILIEPRVEPLSEVIKYKLFALTVSQADVCISDGGTLTRLQVGDRKVDFSTVHTFMLFLNLQMVTT